MDKKQYKNIIIYYICYVVPNSVKFLHLIINRLNECIEENTGNKYLTAVHTDKKKNEVIKYEVLERKRKVLLDQ